MPRELEGYRPQLELLTDMFPGRAAIGITECQAALGIDRRTLLADRRFSGTSTRCRSRSWHGGWYRDRRLTHGEGKELHPDAGCAGAA